MTWKKKLLSIVLCLCTLLTVVATAGAETGGNTGHSHALCAGTTCTDPNHSEGNHGEGVTFVTKLSQGENGKLYIGDQEWTNSPNNGYLLGSGCYYLATDLDLGEYPIRLSNKTGIDVTLCLNGHTITRTESSGLSSTVILSANSVASKFTLCDCVGSGQITHADTMTAGAGIGRGANKTTHDEFIMYNGRITGNKGSGVYLEPNESFTMYGGSITGNSNDGQSSYGGGVYVHSGAAFTMYGGSITNNGAEYGGGVYVGGTFTMHGGSIDGNHASKVGGGIYSGSSSNTIKILGGSVTNNRVNKTGNGTTAKAGGIYVPGSGTLTIGGNVNISGNWQGNDENNKSNSNVYLEGNSHIAIANALSGNGKIGVSTATPADTTKDADIQIVVKGDSYSAITAANKERFTPDTDNKYCEIVTNEADGSLHLKHKHSGGTATCTAAACCTGCNQQYGNSLGHDYTVLQKDESGHWYKCSRCDVEDTADKKEHTGGTATCTEPKTCTVCNQKYGTTLGHDFTGDTYLSNDTQHWKQCKNCTAISEKTDHDVVTDEAKPATTTETGLTGGKHCGVCGKVLVAQEVTPKLSPRYYYNRTTTTTKDTAKKDTTKNPGTFDPGVGIYALTAVLSVTGMAYVGKKKF